MISYDRFGNLSR